MNRTTPIRNRARGMTLIEIMVVIAILGMIAAAVAVGVMQQFGNAQRKTVAMDFKTLESQLDLYIVQKGALPSQSDGLKLLVLTGISRETPKDPWGNPYHYAVNGEEVTLTSYGSDGEPGGTDSAADISKTIKMR
jgi:general secretion pathway protein G